MLGIRLRTLRQQRGLEQAEVARATGIDQATISRIENGKRPPTHAQLIRLAKYFSVSLDALTGATDEREPQPAARVNPSPALPRIQLPVYVEYEDGNVTYLSEEPESYADAFYTQVADDLDNYFYVSVMHEAMVDAGIWPGALVLVHRQSTVENGEIALCRRFTGEIIFRKIWMPPGRIMLIPAHPGMREEMLTPDAITILGKATQVIFDLP